jgi:hypothetical protein
VVFLNPSCYEAPQKSIKKIDRYFEKKSSYFFSCRSSTGALVVPPSTEYFNPHATRGALQKNRMSLFPRFFCSGSSCFGVFLGEGVKNTTKNVLTKRLCRFFFDIEPEKMSFFPRFFYRVFGCFSVLVTGGTHSLRSESGKKKSVDIWCTMHDAPLACSGWSY